MPTGIPIVRKFTTGEIRDWQHLADRNIRLGPAVEKDEGGPLSAYFARFGKGEVAELPAPYEEIWVVMRGVLTIHSGDRTLSARSGDILHVPTDSPGEVRAEEDTELVCVSVPAH